MANHDTYTHGTTVRLEPDDWRYVYSKGRGRSFNHALNYFIGILRQMEAEGLAEIRGYFEPKEWKFMADALKNNTQPICNKQELQRLIMDIRNMEAKSSYYEVSPAELCDKIAGINAVHVLAITQRVHEFWHHSEAVTMDEWARY